MDRDRLSLLANDRFRLTKAIKVDQPAQVTLLTEGGAATFNRVEVWELRPVRNKASRALHHFPPPAWTWGSPQLVAACQDDGSKVGEEMRQRFSADGVKDYDLEP